MVNDMDSIRDFVERLPAFEDTVVIGDAAYLIRTDPSDLGAGLIARLRMGTICSGDVVEVWMRHGKRLHTAIVAMYALGGPDDVFLTEVQEIGDDLEALASLAELEVARLKETVTVQ